ncbi:hypothetical protein [Alienimonas chondri]|uniref:Uncharacterized protein n=1 Tax=Alienimonas chondri TaxID=2681879 RepID=A0ABX1VCS2_9PLAN|nr:hypothetical protein [Alienimonas chondri]NNJ25751.1 hypothetical protein [Alienimonas chondri]
MTTPHAPAGPPLGFPPLPAGTRIRVHRAELHPTPILKATVEPLEADGRRGCLAVWLLGAGAAEVLALITLWSAFVQFGAPGFRKLLAGSACSAVPLLAIVASIWSTWRLMFRARLRAMPGEIQATREWIGNPAPHRSDASRTLLLAEGDLVPAEPPRAWTIGAPPALRARVAGRTVTLTPEVTELDRNWLIEALAAVGAADRFRPIHTGIVRREPTMKMWHESDRPADADKQPTISA